ncbi:hypothetical protein STEG23_032229, partial [Scotinomys teguina]
MVIESDYCNADNFGSAHRFRGFTPRSVGLSVVRPVSRKGKASRIKHQRLVKSDKVTAFPFIQEKLKTKNGKGDDILFVNPNKAYKESEEKASRYIKNR